MKAYAWILGTLLWCMWTSCVTTYQYMHPSDIAIDDYTDTISDKNIIISMDDDVLTIPGTKQYARQQKKNKVCLVALHVQNAGLQEMNFHDLVFQTTGGDPVFPLDLESALESLVKPVTYEVKNSAVEIEGGLGFKILWGAGKVVNAANKLISHVRFVQDMEMYYLENTILLPGEYTKGFLVLPVRKGIPVTVSVREK